MAAVVRRRNSQPFQVGSFGVPAIRTTTAIPADGLCDRACELQWPKCDWATGNASHTLLGIMAGEHTRKFGPSNFSALLAVRPPPPPSRLLLHMPASSASVAPDVGPCLVTMSLTPVVHQRLIVCPPTCGTLSCNDKLPYRPGMSFRGQPDVHVPKFWALVTGLRCQVMFVSLSAVGS